MWYIDKGYIPSISEAKEKLHMFNQKRSNPKALSMSDIYDEFGEKYNK